MNNYIDQSSSQKQQTIYLRSYERNIPSHMLQPYLDNRPVLTKYSIMPIVDPIKPVTTPLIQHTTYTPEKVFYPGNSKGPWSGYASNINHESELKNQIFAVQQCPQSMYIPSSKSSLYKVDWNNSEKPNQPFPGLFYNDSFSPVNPNLNPEKVGFALFNNATRQQTKDLTKNNIL